jgi:hypothetical protein
MGDIGWCECWRGRSGGGAGEGGVVGVLEREEWWGCCRGRSGGGDAEGGVAGVLQREEGGGGGVLQREKWWGCCRGRGATLGQLHLACIKHARTLRPGQQRPGTTTTVSGSMSGAPPLPRFPGVPRSGYNMEG